MAGLSTKRRAMLVLAVAPGVLSGRPRRLVEGPSAHPPPPAALPVWVPEAGQVAVVTGESELLSNKLKDVCAPYYEPSLFWNIRNGDSGPVNNPYWSEYGGLMIHGAGHASTNDNTVVVLEYRASGFRFRRLTAPTAFFGSSTDVQTRLSNARGTVGRDPATGEYTADRQPMSCHTYGALDIIGPEHGGARMGTLMTVMRVAQGHGGQMDTLNAHRLDLEDANGAPDTYAWVRDGALNPSTLSGGPFPAWSQFVPAQGRIYYEARWSSSTRTPRWYNLATKSYEVGTGAGRSNATTDSYYTGRLLHVPERDLLIFGAAENDGQLTIRYMSVSANDTNPSWAGAPAALSSSIGVPPGFSCICWCPDAQVLLVGNTLTDPEAVFEIAIPAKLRHQWPVTKAPFLAGQTIAWPQQTSDPMSRGAPTYKSWEYNPRTRCVVYFPIANTRGGSDRLYVYRPRNT